VRRRPALSNPLNRLLRKRQGPGKDPGNSTSACRRSVLSKRRWLSSPLTPTKYPFFLSEIKSEHTDDVGKSGGEPKVAATGLVWVVEPVEFSDRFPPRSLPPQLAAVPLQCRAAVGPSERQSWGDANLAGGAVGYRRDHLPHAEPGKKCDRIHNDGECEAGQSGGTPRHCR